MSDWCPENDGAYRAEMAAMYPVANRKRIAQLEEQNKRLRLEVAHANDTADVAIERVKELEAKLAKAVERVTSLRGVLHKICDPNLICLPKDITTALNDTDTTLAELTGGKP